MVPTPRSKIRYTVEDPERRVRTRLDLLIALMVVQIALSIGLLVGGHTGDSDLGPPAAAPNSPEETGITIADDPLLWESDEISPPAVIMQSEPEPVSGSGVPDPIRVEVLNGCGVPGIARKTSEYLTKNGYDVREIGNASRQNYRSSTLFDRVGNLTKARELAGFLGIEDDHINRLSGQPSLDVDLTLIIGDDFRRWPLGR